MQIKPGLQEFDTSKQTMIKIMACAQVDYIIVGGGTSGCVIANRLASETDASILLLEAGRDSGSSADVLVPGMYIHQLENDKEGLWEHPTVPQAQLNERRVTMLRGKQIGGSSAVNYMAMARGSSDDYDEWARRTGDDRWRWQHVLPRMRRMEDFDPQVPKDFEHLAAPDPSNHGNGGPIKLGFGTEMTPGVAKFVGACQEVGIDLCPDINSGNPVGVGLAQFNVRDGIRQYAANAYLDDEFRAHHPNLHVQTNTSVERLLFSNGRSIGVVACGPGKTTYTQITCSREVILCAGTFASPQVLLMSGVGPYKTVEELGIPLIRDLSGVGQGMLDHSILTVEFAVKDTAIDFSRLFEEDGLLDQAQKQYQRDRTGPLSVFGSSGSVAFPKIDRLEQSPEFRCLDKAAQAFLRHPMRPSAEIWLGSGRAAYSAAAKSGQSFITFELLLQNNLSRGTVRVERDTEGVPALKIDAKILEHPYDRRIAIETVRKALEIARTKAYEHEIEDMVHGPDCDDDDSILRFVRQNLGQGYHSVGTCRMGPMNDPMSVVDTSFNVIGVPGVKIADLSVCPVLTCNHTQINAYLIGDRCADVLIQNWRSESQLLNSVL